MSSNHTISRRQFLVTTAAVGGAFVLGFHLPGREAEAATIAAKPWTPPLEGGQEVNAWLIIGSDDSVLIRVGQSEMGEGVFTSMPMLVAEELACDWTKVRAEYASANRSLRENRVYQRMATGGSGAVRQLARVSAAGGRQRAAAPHCGGGPAMEGTGERVQGRQWPGHPHRLRAPGQLWRRSAQPQLASSSTPNRPSRSPSKFKLLGTSQKRLDVPLKVDGERHLSALTCACRTCSMPQCVDLPGVWWQTQDATISTPLRTCRG